MRHAFLKNDKHKKEASTDDKGTGADEVVRQKKVGFGGFNFTVGDVFFRTGDEKMSHDTSACFHVSGQG